MKDTADSSAINKTLTALDNYVLLGKSGLRVSPLSLGTMVSEQDLCWHCSAPCNLKADIKYPSTHHYFPQPSLPLRPLEKNG
jgi:hypothetical protein